jgi:hypothetical protein
MPSADLLRQLANDPLRAVDVEESLDFARHFTGDARVVGRLDDTCFQGPGQRLSGGARQDAS